MRLLTNLTNIHLISSKPPGTWFNRWPDIYAVIIESYVDISRKLKHVPDGFEGHEPSGWLLFGRSWFLLREFFCVQKHELNLPNYTLHTTCYMLHTPHVHATRYTLHATWYMCNAQWHMLQATCYTIHTIHYPIPPRGNTLYLTYYMLNAIRYMVQATSYMLNATP